MLRIFNEKSTSFLGVFAFDLIAGIYILLQPVRSKFLVGK